jgi:hypothetical protein
MLTGRKTLPSNVPSPRIAGAAMALLMEGVGIAVAAMITSFL